MQNTSLSDIRLVHTRKLKDVNDFLDALRPVLRSLEKWEHDPKLDALIKEMSRWVLFIERM